MNYLIRLIRAISWSQILKIASMNQFKSRIFYSQLDQRLGDLNQTSFSIIHRSSHWIEFHTSCTYQPQENLMVTEYDHNLHAINIILNIADPILECWQGSNCGLEWVEFQRIMVVRVADEDGKAKAMRITNYWIHISCNILKR